MVFVLMHMENSDVIVACITLASDVVFKRLIGYSWPAIGLIVHYKKAHWMLRGCEVPKTPSKYPND